MEKTEENTNTNRFNKQKLTNSLMKYLLGGDIDTVRVLRHREQLFTFYQKAASTTRYSKLVSGYTCVHSSIRFTNIGDPQASIIQHHNSVKGKTKVNYTFLHAVYLKCIKTSSSLSD